MESTFYRIKKALNLPSDESLIMFSKETEILKKAWTLIEGILLSMMKLRRTNKNNGNILLLGVAHFLSIRYDG